ncbi:hypothetical protein R1sor_024998 [Riccia sorocarpa]|uniref:Uncharacterized protein n=1 Tax=Riccia sorocarpa TaxID=122646 RepID=A0ABD3GAF5_9MARC
MALQSLCLSAITLKSPPSVSGSAGSEFFCGQQGLRCSWSLAGSSLPSRSSFSGRRTVVRSKLPKKDPGYGLREYGIPSYKTPSYKIPQPPFKSTTKKAVNVPIVGKGKRSSSKPGTPSFWNYAAPRNYTAPGDYGAPKAYDAPSGYGPDAGANGKTALVEVETGKTEAGLEGVSPEYQDATVNAELKEAEPELGGGDGGAGKEGGGGGGGGDRGKGDGEGEGEREGDKQPEKKMSMSQKLTLAYAALVGVGGVIGFVKSGSAKSLATGGGAALALYYVYTQLPVNPVFASSFGLGISAVLLAVMGPRFKKSGKFMPAGLVAVYSLVMTAGYLHGIMRSSH